MSPARIRTLAVQYIRLNPLCGIREIDQYLRRFGFKGRADVRRLSEVIDVLGKQGVVKTVNVQYSGYVVNHRRRKVASCRG